MTRDQWDSKLLWTAQLFAILAFPAMIFGPAPIDIAVSLIAVLFLIRSAIMRDWTWTGESWVRVLLLLWLYSLFCCFFAQDMEPAFKRILPWLRYVVVAPALAYWVLTDARAQKRLFFALLGTLAFLCFDSLLQYITGTDLFGREKVMVTSQLRLTGPFSNPRVGITIAWVAFPVLCVLLTKGSLGRRLTGAVATALVIGVVFMSGERMGFLLSLFGAACAFVLVPRARLPLIVAAIIGAIALGALMHTNPDLKDRQIKQSSTEIVGFWQSSYGQLWLSSLAMAREYPLTGVGPRNFRNRCPEPQFGPTDEQSLFLRCPMHPHNNYMEWLAETGLIGFGLYVTFGVLLLAKLWKVRHDVLLDPLLGGLAVTLLIRLWPLSAVTSQFSPWSAGPYWILVGWLVARIVAAERKARALP